ncbi:hypothetical protein FS749_009909 [Ceratobasidium sp. UAMH 11750]|nr:hypothetical protein FS749_009909 [Ceratobasidium sp. UAMH 11750]
MAFVKHGASCSCCRGPAAWSALYPLAPTSSIDSNSLSAHSQPEIAKSRPKFDWVRVPNWALPTRATPLAAPEDEPLITLDTILAGRTKSPIRVEDLREFLRNEESPDVAALRSLEFLLTYNSFRAAFFNLPPEKQSPRPSTMQQSLLLANKAAEIQLTFAQLPPSARLTRPQAAKAVEHAEKGRLPPDLSVGDDKRPSHKLRKNESGDYSIASTSSRQSLLASVNVVKRIVRLTGTAVDTIPVEDSRVRKLQATVGLRVAIWLFLGTSMVVGIIMAIP